MDKKSKYQQPASKPCCAAELKKNQDVTSSKLFPKSSRRREPVGANGPPKYDQPRKSAAQKAKSFDKRPKPKGYHRGCAKEDSKVADSESAEVGSVMAQGSKKQNLNHLLNFHYEPRDAPGGWNHGRTSGYNGQHYNRWLPPVHRHKYNKEQFLQANCQFVVTAKGDYSLYLNDPDVLIDWKLIQQIRVHSSDRLSCPICLCPPVAGKMTRCGHVYCWPCILHYLALSDKSWRKCPICYESVHKSDLKSVVEITESVFNAGDQISLRLMRREKGSLLAVPVSDVDAAPPSTFLSVSQNSCQQAYSKLLLAQNNDIMDILEYERVQLKLELLEDPQSPENCFIEQALGELLSREKLLFEPQIRNEQSGDVATDGAKNPDDLDNVKFEAINDAPKILNLGNSSNMKGHPNGSNSNNNDVDVSPNLPAFYYFYQAGDGQNVYLHAMNVKMLEMQYGSLEKSPLVISGKLLEKEVGSFTEELRRRMRYLCHLPVTSMFEIVEIELQPPVVSEEVLESFDGQIITRQKKRQRREREERKREKKINEEENKRMGKYPIPDVHIESRKHFPQFQAEISDPMSSTPPESLGSSSVASSPSVSSFDELVADNEINYLATADQGPSFAQMLQNRGSKRNVAWPTPSTSKKPIDLADSTSRESHQQMESIDPELQEYMPPTYNQSLGDALAEALEKSDLLQQGCGNPADGATSGKKKKKKGKAMVLFATSMARTS